IRLALDRNMAGMLWISDREPGVRELLAKPFCMEDLEAAIEWLRETPRSFAPPSAGLAAIAQRSRPRRPRGRLPAP
ncbi:MAG: hypothetical protein ABIP01_05050, partial [Candidatus Limnocylindria bacterium]